MEINQNFGGVNKIWIEIHNQLIKWLNISPLIENRVDVTLTNR